ncbi:MAG: hypothetical protein DHS20C16_16610 [Phycisphaerae bacterium]|nr:MAG: hypothetical protein DHS20C16_16610 [Phycisphaerae bacterium]
MKPKNEHNKKILKQFIPVIYTDEHYLAVAKPPRIDLESTAWRRGPRFIDLVEASSNKNSNRSGDESEVSLTPLILPERYATGVALFARSDEAKRRFAGMGRTGKLRFAHVVVANGKPPRTRITLKPNRVTTKKKTAKPLQQPAKIEMLDSTKDRHVARCNTGASSFEEVRKAFRLGGLSIEGDQFITARKAEKPKQLQPRPLVHLEQLTFPHPFEKNRELNVRAPIPGPFLEVVRSGSQRNVHLNSALSIRLSVLLEKETDCLRLFCGKFEGISGLVVDRYKNVIVLEAQQGKFQGGEEELGEIADWYAAQLKAKSVYLMWTARAGEGGVGKDRPVELIRGEAADETTVLSKGTKYIVKPGLGLSSGLFLDHRDNRAYVAKLAQNKTLLNLFCYTCGFSVAAAREGAKTTNVDLSVSSLEWGKRNFEANGLSLDDHMFIKSDAFDYFKRALRQKKSFDVIVIDPPSFARTKKPKRTFEVKKNMIDLIVGAIPLVKGGGHMLLATNHRQLPLAWLIEQVEDACDRFAAQNKRGPRGFQIVSKPKLPVDFAPDRALQKTIVVRFD